MARVTHVKRAQQRYATVPVIDPETGQPKRTPVMRKNGEQKVTKHGRPVFMTVTRQDRDKPLPPETCDYCRKPIEVGTPYKHITPKSGPYGGRKRSRHASCPTWQVWEYSSSLSARLAQVEHEAEQMLDQEFETAEDVSAVASEIAEMVREIAQEKIEAADNMEDGFGHETYQSQEIRETGEALESWADDIENVDIPDSPDEESECDECAGSGEKDVEKWVIVNADGSGPVDDSHDIEEAFDSEEEARDAIPDLVERLQRAARAAGLEPTTKAEEFDVEEDTFSEDCEECNGTGQVENETSLDDWREEARQAVLDEVGNVPV